MTSDIDRERLYRTTFLVLTNQRFFSQSPTNGLQEWPLSGVDKIKTKDRGGLGTLELLGPERRLAYWHFTIAQGPSALVLVDRFDELKSTKVATVAVDDEDVPEAEEQEAPPNTWVMLRLWTFAKPHAGWMFLALMLSLISNVALVESAKILRKHLNPIITYREPGPETVPDSGLRNMAETTGYAPVDLELEERLSRSLAELNLSVRATNCLESEGINTVRDLVVRTDDQLLQVRNFGDTTLQEVRERLASIGLRLGMRLPQSMQQRDR
jgi:hypothetical protein